MAYTSFTISEDKKEKRYRVSYTSEKGGWSGSGHLCDLYRVDGKLVMTLLNNKPFKIFDNITQFSDYLEQNYYITPKIDF